MSKSDTEDAAAKKHAALLRSMPVTRMLDYGMDYWDACQLRDAPASTPWEVTAESLADAQLARADEAAACGNTETAVSCYRRATAALIFAQMSFNSDTLTKVRLYRKLTGAYDRAAELDAGMRVERMQVASPVGTCNAWLARAAAGAAGPAVIILGGQSGWGPAYHAQAAALTARGMSAVLLEAPGQGETRMLYGLHLDSRVDLMLRAVVDSVRERTGHSGLFGVWGNSFGGLLAARAAVHDSRCGACCVNGARARPVPLPQRTAREQTHALLGVEDDDTAEAVLRTLWLDPAAGSTQASMLVLHGGMDPLVSQEQQEDFLSLSNDSRIRIWDDGEHTIYNHSAERTDFVADWFCRTLEP